MRITVQDFANSRAPEVLGLCSDNYPQIYSYLNEAIQRLIMAGGETGWYGGWWKVVFDVTQSDPFITTPYNVARLIEMAVCDRPILVQNPWFEFLWAGVGLQKQCTTDGQTCAFRGVMEAFDRGTVATQYPLTDTNQYIRVYYTDARDVGKKVYFNNALDQNGNGIYTQDGLHSVNGFYLLLDTPFSTSAFIVTEFGSVTKEATFGDVLVKQVDATTGVESLLSRLKPTETSPQYRRYFIQNLPSRCCDTPEGTTSQVTAMAKLEFIPVSNPTDVLMIGNLPALKEECMAIRYSEMESPEAKGKAELHHRNAIRELNRELTHYLGKERPAINVAIFGTAHLSKQAIGTLI